MCTYQLSSSIDNNISVDAMQQNTKKKKNQQHKTMRMPTNTHINRINKIQNTYILFCSI